jgi:hypothetical protein
MRGVVVVERRRAVEVDFLHRPVERAVGVAQRQGAEIAGDEDGNAGVIVPNATPPCVLVEVDRRAEGQAVIGRAGHGEGDVDILHELGRYAGAALETHFCRTAQRDVGGCYASSGHKGSRSEENLFHVQSLFSPPAHHRCA